MENEVAVINKSVKKRQPKVNMDLPATPENMLMAAVQQGMSVDVIDKLVSLKERLEKSESEKAFRAAMSNFQAECPVIPKKKKVMNKDGKSVRYKYAPLDDIIKIAQKYIGQNGLSYDIETLTVNNEVEKGISVKLKIFHVMGHSKETSFFTPIDPEAYMNEPQKWASAQTFAKRYAFCNGFGILTGDADDDGNVIGDPKAEKQLEAENIAKVEALPDDIKQGMRAMGYKTVRTAFIFCNDHDFDNAKIKAALDRMANNG
jgi:hypothetical protein